jgi:hypothetical protein
VGSNLVVNREPRDFSRGFRRSGIKKTGQKRATKYFPV